MGPNKDFSPTGNPKGEGGGGGGIKLIFAGYVPLFSQSPYYVIVYFWANYRRHLRHFWANVIFAIPN